MANPTFKLIPIDSIDLAEGERSNIRTMEGPEWDAGVEAMAHSIAKTGIQQPLILNQKDGERYELVAGHRRLAGAKYAVANLGLDIRNVPAVVHRQMFSDRQRLETMIADRQSLGLTPIELGRAMSRLMKITGLSQSDVAKEFGLSYGYVGDLNMLANAPQDIQNAVDTGVVSSTLAVKVLKEDGPEVLSQLVEEHVKEVEAAKAAEVEEEEQAEGEAANPAEPLLAVLPPKSAGGKRGRKPAGKTAKKASTKSEVLTDKKVQKIKARLRGETAAPAKPNKKEAASLLTVTLDAVDEFLAAHKAGQDTAHYLEALAWCLREAAMAGYSTAQDKAGVNADTSDEELTNFAKPAAEVVS